MSVDSPYAHRAWGTELNVEFPMVSDFERTVLRDYDAATSDDVPFLSGIGKHCAFLVDAEGVLRGVWYPPKSGGLSPVQEVLDAARALSG